jgi:hypothetical protein
MAYGTVKVDNITFDNGGSDQNVTVSGLYNSLTSGITVTGTISGAVVIGSTSVSGTTVQGASGTFTSLTGTTIQGTTATYTTGTFTSLTGTTTQGTTATYTTGSFTSLTGTTTTGTTSSFTSGVFTTLSGATATFTSGIIASGTAAAPSLAILGDPNTGIYSPGADQLAVTTNGAGRLYIASDGKVGIGTSSPDSLLEVRDSTSSGIISRSSNTQGTNTNTALKVRNNSDTNTFSVSYRGQGYFADSVGIGTTSPSVNLQVQDDSSFSLIRVVASSGNVAGIDFGDAADTDTAGVRYDNVSDSMAFRVNASERARIDSSGRLLVGTSSAFATRLGASAITPGFQVKEGGAGSVLLFNSANSASPATIYTVKSRGATYGTIVQNNDNLFRISAAGDDGVQATEAARIDIAVDGTPGANDMPGRIVLSTTADGASTPTERMRIDSSGNVGIGDSSPSTRGRLSVISTAGVGRQFVVTTAGVSQMRFDNNAASINLELQNYGMTAANHGAVINWSLGNSLANANTAGSITVASEGIWGATSASRDSFMAFSTTLDGNVRERVRIDSSGRLLVGTSTNYAIGDSSGWSVQVVNSAGISNLRTGNNSSPSYLVLAKTRATSAGSFAILQNNDIVGDISFAADDGTDYATNAAKIRCEVDGTPGANDMPARLVFSTTADGASLPTERMRINSSGNVGIGTNSPGTKLHVNTGVAGNLAYFEDGINSDFYIKTASLIATIGPNAGSTSLAFQTSGTERMRINSSGNVGIGTNSPGTKLHVNTGVAGNLAYFEDGINSDFYIKTASLIATIGPNAGSTSLAFQTSGTERMRIDSSGNTTLQTIGAYLRIKSGSTDFDISAQPGASDFIRINANGTQRFQFNGAGGAYSSTGTWGTISDLRLKENIADASSKIEEVKSLRVVNYNLLSDPGVKQIGFIAQEIEEVFPSLVEETGTVDGVENVKAVKTTVLIPVLVKALQEAIAKIEVLEQRLNDAGIN